MAVSANLCALAVGTETDGSIIWPSHMNGTVPEPVRVQVVRVVPGDVPAPGGGVLFVLANKDVQNQHDGAGQLDELPYAQRLQLPGRPGHQSL